MQPIAKEGPSENASASPKGEMNFSLAAEPTKHNCGMMDIELSSEGLDDSGMEVPPLLNTQHNVGVDADMSSEGQATCAWTYHRRLKPSTAMDWTNRPHLKASTAMG